MEKGKDIRFAHAEGITDVGVDDDGKKLYTCGAEGDIRVWDGYQDKDPVTFSASDTCLCLKAYKDKIYVGTENNTVEAYKLPDGKSLGVKVKFTSTVNHLDVSRDGKYLVAGSADMTIKLVNLEDGSQPKLIADGHKAPVLSVVFDPQVKYFASSGCDGNVCIWTVEETPRCKLKWDNLYPKSNDILQSQTLCRMAWDPLLGKTIAIPWKDKIIIYTRDTWEELETFTSKVFTKMISLACYSSTGKLLAAGGHEGAIVIWNMETSQKIFEKTENYEITGLKISLDSSELYLTDSRGRLITYTDFSKNALDSEAMVVDSDKANVDDPFDDGNDALFFDDASNDNEISISKIKADAGYGEDGEYIGVEKAKKLIKNDDDDDDESVTSSHHSYRPKPTIIQKMVNPFTEPQKPFQSGSSPVSVEHRFMMWNNIGIIRSYNSGDYDAIDVEFHDASFHASIHVTNTFDFTIASLSTEVVALGCQRTDEHPSKLFCLHFSTWDSSKEWTSDLPEDENVVGIATGKGWIAAATDINRIRLYSIGGAQKLIYDMPGQIVSIAGNEDVLFVTYHFGVGINNNQNICYSLYKVKGVKMTGLVVDACLPLSSKSQLSWVGFTEEGTPIFNDTGECFRMLNGRTWIPVFNFKDLLNGPNDHFWIVGASETEQNIKAIKCRSSKYPPVLPRPNLMMIDMKIPLCEIETEKGEMEDLLLRSFLLNFISKKVDIKGYDTEEFKEKSDKNIKESLIKLLALCVKSNRDFRATDYVSLLPTAHSMQIAIKYATKMNHNSLAERIIQMARNKLDEEDENDNDFLLDDFETTNRTPIQIVTTKRSLDPTRDKDDDYFKIFAGGDGNGNGDSDHFEPRTKRSRVTPDLDILPENPIMSKQRAEINAMLNPGIMKRANNPFKIPIPDSSGEKDKSQDNNTPSKGIAVIDAWKKPVVKTTDFDFVPKNPNAKKKNTAKKNADKDKDKEGNKDSKDKEKEKVEKSSSKKVGRKEKPSTSTTSIFNFAQFAIKRKAPEPELVLDNPTPADAESSLDPESEAPIDEEMADDADISNNNSNSNSSL